jgi:lactobin A/cerein 7B family class IIb bacteriocin
MKILTKDEMFSVSGGIHPAFIFMIAFLLTGGASAAIAGVTIGVNQKVNNNVKCC